MYENSPHTVYQSEYAAKSTVLPDGTKSVRMGSGVTTGILGEGGTAVVYRIWNEQLGINRAVKLLKPSASQKSKERFIQEVKILAQLHHPNIINVHSQGDWNGLPYIEMDLMEGLSLEQVIEENGALPLSVVLAIGIEIAHALDYTHSHRYHIDAVEYTGLLHRDLKPANILLPHNDMLRLTDFGIASLTTSLACSASSEGTIVGSMKYLAPEQLENRPLELRSDIFSFGCVLYEMLVGSCAFPEKNMRRLVKMRVKNEYIPLKRKRKKIPVALEALILSCMSVNPEARPESMKKVLTILEDIYRERERSRPEELVNSFMEGKTFGESTNKKRNAYVRRRIIRKALMWGCISFLISGILILSTGYWYLRTYKPEFLEKLIILIKEEREESSLRRNNISFFIQNSDQETYFVQMSETDQEERISSVNEWGLS